MVLFETMRIRLAKTAAKLVTANTTAPNNATSQPTSSVASVEMQATWLEIVLIGMNFSAMLEREKC
jgi:hypothetical protein